MHFMTKKRLFTKQTNESVLSAQCSEGRVDKRERGGDTHKAEG
jgi:hypothetical protein